MTKLHEVQVVGDEMFYHTIGMKRYGNKYQKTFGLQAKYFNNKKPGYIYPFFKTHKFTPKDLMDVDIYSTKPLSGYSNLWVRFTRLDLLRS